jgi:hypothetical protein
MRGHADVVEMLEYVFGDTVVQHALAFNYLMLFALKAVASSLKC